jgi:hypothetical protein
MVSPWPLRFFLAAMPFAAVANVCAFQMLHRMKSIGFTVGLWRSLRKDLALYRGYWNIAPKRNWSRLVLVVGVASFGIAMVFMGLAAFSMQHIAH